MHFQQPQSAGPQVETPPAMAKPAEKHLTSPSSQHVPLASVSGTAYSTAVTLVQQVAYSLSDKLFTYSPETFDLDVAVQHWKAAQEKNAFGFIPGVEGLEVRSGAGTLALGYVFSPDFDISKRHIPQSIIASAGSLPALRTSLDQLSLLYALSNPFVAHVSSVDYNGGAGLVSDYTTALELADEVGLGLLSSASPQETQHMALLGTLLAKFLPTLHIYDGVTAGRQTFQAQNLLNQQTLAKVYASVLKQVGGAEAKHSDTEGKALRLLNAFNSTLGTQYRPFEYAGHPQAEKVVVAFGTLESSVVLSFVQGLADQGHKVGAINVRLYRPFIEEAFLQVIPQSAKEIVVLGQVKDDVSVTDDDSHSQLYQDVLSALTFSVIAARRLTVQDAKYSRHQQWTSESVSALLERLTGISQASSSTSAQSYTFWTLDESPTSKIAAALSEKLIQTGLRLSFSTTHDNLVQGGTTFAGISVSNGSISPLSPQAPASVAFVSSEKLFIEVDIPRNIQEGGSLILSLAGVADEDLVKKIPEETRLQIVERRIQLYILDLGASPSGGNDADEVSSLAQQSFSAVSGLLQNGAAETEELNKVLRKVEIPETWTEVENVDEKRAALPSMLQTNSFVPFDRKDEDDSSLVNDWTIAARGALFKEAYGTNISLRPDLGIKTSIVHVKEHRRLTPLSYERNVFHIEFDLGTSGLTYAIGEALGIHAENDPVEVETFIDWYGLNPAEIIQVPSREDPSILENRTVYQALIQNVDIFGRPPKRFYEALAEFATDENEKRSILTLSLPEGATEFKRRAEVDTVTFADIFAEFPSAHPAFQDLVRIVSPMKRREYSIASSQHHSPNSVSLLIVTVNWNDTKGRERTGQATRYLNSLKVGTPVTVSVKPSVMKLPQKTTAPIIMAGLGTGLAPFRAFVQERAYQKHVLGQEIGSVLLYLGSRHQREEYLYGEEWEAYQAAGIITLIGKAFSRDQPQKIYIQDRMRQSLEELRQAYIREEGSFYLCGPTWPVPDVTEVLQEVVETELKANGAKKVDSKREIETLKDGGRFVLEVY